jgi:energy-converting hydrogenase Eha subunit A
MKPTFNDKLIAYLVLFSGLAISGVAEYYSIMGLMAIYPAAIIPIVIMGIVLGIGKISATVWLKQNWEWSPFFLKAYVLPAIVVLMLITSLGVFGYLSKAHSDQSLVSGDVQSKIAVYDEKIRIAKDNIDANRKALKQMDEAVDQVMGRSSDEKGADKAVSIRRSQQKERVRLQSEIASEQKTIAAISEERAPIAAEVRKVEAEVGPIKYIAHLLYGENPDANILEKAVIWVTILIVIVLDPLAVVLLLAAQYSFQRFRQIEEDNGEAVEEWFRQGKERARQLDEERANEILKAGVTNSNSDDAMPIAEGDSPQEPTDVVGVGTTVTTTATVAELETPVPIEQWNEWIAEAERAVEAEKQPPVVELTMAEKHPYLNTPFVHFSDLKPMASRVEEYEEPVIEPAPMPEPTSDMPERPGDYVEQPTFDFEALSPEQDYVTIDGQRMHVRAARGLYVQTPKVEERPTFTEVVEPEIRFGSYVQNEEQSEGTKWNRVISESEYREQAQAKLNDNKNNTNNAA